MNPMDVDNSMDVDVGAGDFLDVIMDRDKRITRSAAEETSRNQKGVTDEHYRRGVNIEQSFLEGIGAVCKFMMWNATLIWNLHQTHLICLFSL